MPHCIVRIFEPLLRLLWPAPGRHRSPDQPSTGLCVEAPTACPSRPLAPPVLRGEEIGLVRPYLVAHERREQQRRRARRRVVRLAVHGIDIDARLVGGVEVRAW
ncbi:hypothetical protein J7F01_30545 [Streptomyces sp. ISL-22]|uniref:hypothetical protein n=1 Tax=unclassified Streptomyces TaxID=2593676 RepID=UPI001BE61041|nr:MULTISPECIES: hypothetical protein [unclassified Streptomyces]MBT2419659.1 hypothetical protein [Streptomyces sp. ISL-24]MBT2436424.1 hypothetical protein [Streptomyces sp. ISL-22]